MTIELRMKITQQMGFAVGYASLCWEPKPHGVFNSTQASKAVDHAMKYIDPLLDVAEAAQEVIRTCGGLPGTEVLHEMEKALEKLEAVK